MKITPPTTPLSPTRRSLFIGTASLAALAAPQCATATPRRINQAELDAIAARHAQWHRKQPGGVQANLGGCDLSGLQFGRWELRYANFAGANMQGIRATETRFFRAHMTGCDLSEAWLLDCDLRHANLTRAILDDSRILDSQSDWLLPLIDEDRPWYAGGGLGDAQLVQATLRNFRANVSLYGAVFEKADLRHADLRGTFGSAYFSGADLRDADLSGVQLSESDFENARMDRVNVDGAYLLNCNLTQAQIKGLRNTHRANIGHYECS